jgi:predicted Fe-Mo cluster-binding NifX family protein
MENLIMKIAIPVANGTLCAHFGHCEKFALIDVDPDAKTIIGRSEVDAPPHQPGLLPPWLAERGAKVIIAGGMGERAQMLFAQQGIQVIVGVASNTVDEIITAYLAGTLAAGENCCDH